MNTAPEAIQDHVADAGNMIEVPEDDSLMKWFDRVGRVLMYAAIALGVLNIVNQAFKMLM